MKIRVSLAIAMHVAATLSLAPRVAGADVGECVEVSPLGYCIRWDVPAPGGPPSGGGNGDTRPDEVVCFWVTVDNFGAENDPTNWADFGITPPPEGVTVVWQTRECSDGTFFDEFRWIIPATPANLAAIARGRLVGELPQPSVGASPPIGTPSIVGVPVFVEMTNWTGVVSEQECAGGLCVTVTATPALSLLPGEDESTAVSCTAAGTRYDPDGDTAAVQAAAVGACTHTYRLRTGVSGRPAEWPGSVSVTWTIGWVASNGTSGSVQPVTRVASLPRAVEEVQTVVVGGASP
jgi:hypothetical protein